MDAESLFGNIVVLMVFAIIFIALTGGNPDPLIELLPSIIVIAVALALVIAVIDSV